MSSVVIKSANRDQITRAVTAYVARLRAAHPEVERAIWFGSWVNGLPTPGSDVDLCLVVSGSDQSPHERISAYLPVGFPVGIDLFVYTPAELDHLRDTSPGWYEAIMSGQEVME